MTTAPSRPTAIDTHAHCYDVAGYRESASSGFHLADNERGSVEDYAAVLDAHGVSHAVLTNPLGGYGTDNSYLLRVLNGGRGRFKGVALLPDAADDAVVARFVDAGIVGIRFNLNFPASPSLYGSAGDRALAIARENDWLIQLHYAGDTILPALERVTDARRLVIDHCGRPDLDAGLDQPGFQALLALGREGRAYIKLSALFRLSSGGPPYTDCDPYLEALVDAFTIERCLWGSDWPFLHARRRVDYGPQRAWLDRLIPDAAQRQRILCDNPVALYGF